MVGHDDFDRLLDGQRDLHHARTRDVGKLTQSEDAIDYGATGPVLRASPAWTSTCAANEPYSIYDRFDFEGPDSALNGDSYDRYLVRLEEVRQSVSIVRQALDQMPDDGPIMPERMPRLLRPAAGQVYMR